MIEYINASIALTKVAILSVFFLTSYNLLVIEDASERYTTKTVEKFLAPYIHNTNFKLLPYIRPMVTSSRDAEEYLKPLSTP